MATAFASTAHAEDRAILREVTWETYVRLCDENQCRATTMAYFEGHLEIMTAGLLHETARWLIHSMVGGIAESLEIDSESTGQYTYRHPAKLIGFEADLSFYVTKLEAIRGRTELNLAKDPPPDLVIEVDVSRNSARQLLMYAALGIREVWRCEGSGIHIYRLSGRKCKTASKSSVFGGVSAALLTQLLADGRTMAHPKWLRHVRKTVVAK